MSFAFYNIYIEGHCRIALSVHVLEECDTVFFIDSFGHAHKRPTSFLTSLKFSSAICLAFSVPSAQTVSI